MATILLSLNDAKTHLGITDGASDADLQVFIDAAARVIESRVGPIDSATYTRTFTTAGGTSSLALGHTQVASVSSLVLVSDGSSPMTIGDLVPDVNTGIVRSKSATFPTVPFTITYTVGPRSLTGLDNLKVACRLLVQTWWKTRRGKGSAPRTGQGDSTPTMRGIPAEVEALLMPNGESLGFA